MDVHRRGLDRELDVADAAQPGVEQRHAAVVDVAELPQARVGGETLALTADELGEVDCATALLRLQGYERAITADGF